MSEQVDLTDYTDSNSEEDSGWTKKRLGEVFDSIYSGGTPKKGVNEYYGGNIPFVKIEDLNEQQGDGITTAENYITEQALKETSTRAFDSGTLLMTIYGSLAETAIVQSRVATNQGILGLWDSDDDNVLYVRYAIDDSQTKLASLSRQTTQANLGKGIVKKHKIPIPPLSEQRKIATILYTIDRAIEKTGGIINQISTVKEGVKDDLLTGGLRDTETTEMRLGPVSTKIPTHWDTGRIGDLFTDRQLGTDERGSTEDGENIDLIKMGNLDFGTWDLSEVEKSRKTHNCSKKQASSRETYYLIHGIHPN
jgi:type I restriction enzyme S subunit